MLWLCCEKQEALKKRGRGGLSPEFSERGDGGFLDDEVSVMEKTSNNRYVFV